MSLDVLAAAARRYYELKRRLARLDGETGWAASMARGSLTELLEYATRDLQIAAEVYGNASAGSDVGGEHA